MLNLVCVLGNSGMRVTILRLWEFGVYIYEPYLIYQRIYLEGQMNMRKDESVKKQQNSFLVSKKCNV